MPIKSETVRSLIACKWPVNVKGRHTLLDPKLGADCTWADTIDIYEKTVARHLAIVAEDPNMPNRMKIAHRIIIDTCLRRSSDTAQFYTVPLYVSGGFLEKLKGGAHRYKGHTEHVIPLSLCSGTAMMKDPALFATFRMAAIGPLCKVSVEEHATLNRIMAKKHPDPAMPFSRYAGQIDVYRTDTGEAIDVRLWSFRNHLDLMRKFPAYATGVEHYESASRATQASR